MCIFYFSFTVLVVVVIPSFHSVVTVAGIISATLTLLACILCTRFRYKVGIIIIIIMHLSCVCSFHHACGKLCDGKALKIYQMRRECVVQCSSHQRQRWWWHGERWKHLLVCSFIFASIYVNSEHFGERRTERDWDSEHWLKFNANIRNGTEQEKCVLVRRMLVAMHYLKWFLVI